MYLFIPLYWLILNFFIVFLFSRKIKYSLFEIIINTALTLFVQYFIIFKILAEKCRGNLVEQYGHQSLEINWFDSISIFIVPIFIALTIHSLMFIIKWGLTRLK